MPRSPPLHANPFLAPCSPPPQYVRPPRWAEGPHAAAHGVRPEGRGISRRLPVHGPTGPGSPQPREWHRPRSLFGNQPTLNFFLLATHPQFFSVPPPSPISGMRGPGLFLRGSHCSQRVTFGRGYRIDDRRSSAVILFRVLTRASLSHNFHRPCPSETSLSSLYIVLSEPKKNARKGGDLDRSPPPPAKKN